MFNKYYQEELSFLRDLGPEFAKAYPTLAPYLAEPGADPDVERLFEGVSFLTGRIRQKLDDELPELTHTLMGLLWPHYLRPIPSMTMIEFLPLPQMLREPALIPRGTTLDSVPVEGTACHFRTCYDVQMFPLKITDVRVETPIAAPMKLAVAFELFSGVDVASLAMHKLRLHLHGDPVLSSALYLWLTNHVHHVDLVCRQAGDNARHITLPPKSILPVGFHRDESLLPYPLHSFAGYQYLQDYFSFPGKFRFIDLTGLEALAQLEVTDKFEIVFQFTHTPDDPPRATTENIRLHCTPAVNLFAGLADPIRVEQRKTQYLVRASSPDPDHLEIFTVDKVEGLVHGTAERRTYEPFYSFKHGLAGREGIYYQTLLREATVGPGTTTYVSFVTAEKGTAIPDTETISLDLTCSNRHLPKGLRVGDIREPTSDSPEFATFRNIVRPTDSVVPPLGEGLIWRLISHLSLNYLSITSVDALRGILGLYNFRALYDRQAARENELRLEGIVDVATRHAERLLPGGGGFVRGIHTEIALTEDNFAGQGDLYLFATVLNEFIGLYATMNSFTQTTVRGVQFGEVYAWPPRIGRQIIL